MPNDFVLRNGFTSKTDSIVEGSMSATTYYGDGTNLTGIIAETLSFSGGILTQQTFFNSRVTSIIIPLTFSSVTTTDLSLGNEFSLTLTGSTTLANPSNSTENGQLFKYIIRQDGIGGHIVSFDTKFRFGNEIGLPSVDINPNRVSYIGVRYNADDDRFDIIAFVSGY
jgi:hypothetical protein